MLRDQVIFFYKLAQAGIDAYFRRIEFYDEEHDRVLVFLTSHRELAAATIAAIYKERWQIELFFRVLKQSLRVKTFVGTSAQALKTQLWTALIWLDFFFASRSLTQGPPIPARHSTFVVFVALVPVI